MKNKLLNIIFVNRMEIKNKWWNRLANVLIISSTIIVFILVAYINYNSVNNKVNVMNTLEGYTLNQLQRMEEISLIQDSTTTNSTLKKISCNQIQQMISKGLSLVKIKDLSIEKGYTLPNKCPSITFAYIFEYIMTIIIVTSCWFIFWESIIYRIIIYIIFGKSIKS